MDRPIEANPRLLVEDVTEIEQGIEEAYRQMREAYERAQREPQEVEGRIWANSRISSFERVVGNAINTLETSDTVTRQEDAAASHLASRIDAFSKMLEHEFPFLREAGDESPREAVYESPIHKVDDAGGRDLNQTRRDLASTLAHVTPEASPRRSALDETEGEKVSSTPAVQNQSAAEKVSSAAAGVLRMISKKFDTAKRSKKAEPNPPAKKPEMISGPTATEPVEEGGRGSATLPEMGEGDAADYTPRRETGSKKGSTTSSNASITATRERDEKLRRERLRFEAEMSQYDAEDEELKKKTAALKNKRQLAARLSLATEAAIDLEHEVHQELIEENDSRGLEYTSAGLLLDNERPGDRTNAWVAEGGDGDRRGDDVDDDDERDDGGDDEAGDLFTGKDASGDVVIEGIVPPETRKKEISAGVPGRFQAADGTTAESEVGSGIVARGEESDKR